MMDEHSLRVLEFTRVLDELGDRCASAAGRARAASLRPSPEADAVGVLLAETEEALRLLRAGEPLPQSPLEDLVPPLRSLKSGGEPWDGGLFLDLLALLGAASRLRRHLAERKERAPSLFQKAEGLPLLHPLAAQIRRTVDERGEVRDEASPALARLRARARGLREELRATLERILEAHADVVQEPLITQRRERYVLPLKVRFRRALQGVVHDRSASGHTLYVEPLVTCPLNNALAEVAAEEAREVRRILRALTEAVREAREELLQLSERLAEFDLIAAKASLAAAWEGVVPERGSGWRVSLRRARHPLLALGGRAVPVDVELGGPFRQLVITGPNTGGKTVALKTLGLLALLHQAGIPVPAAEGSRLPVFAEVFADIGDEQDLEQSLST
ncbi:MAG: endonuclease MutS2, partial [Nitrospinota bacterium]